MVARTRRRTGQLQPKKPDQTSKTGAGLRTRPDPRYGNRPRATIELGVEQTAILLGEEDLSTWDTEELRHGRRKSERGRFEGRPPKVIPRVVYLELVDRYLAEAHLAILDQTMPAIRRLAEMIDGYRHDDEGNRVMVEGDDGKTFPIPISVDKGQLTAVQEVLVRVLGKPETKVSVRAEKKGYERIERVEIDRDLGTYDDEIIDTTAVEE